MCAPQTGADVHTNVSLTSNARMLLHNITGSVFWQVDPNNVQLRVGCLYTTMYLSFFKASLVPFPGFLADRAAFYSQRERSFYSTLSLIHI